MKVATGQADTDSRLVFVPCEHPYFDSSKPQGLDGLLDFVLESAKGEKQSSSINASNLTYFLLLATVQLDYKCVPEEKADTERESRW